MKKSHIFLLIIFSICCFLIYENVNAETIASMQDFYLENYEMIYPDLTSSQLIEIASNEAETNQDLSAWFSEYSITFSQFIDNIAVTYSDYNHTGYKVIFGRTPFKLNVTDANSTAWRKESLETNGYIIFTFDLNKNITSISHSKTASNTLSYEIFYKQSSTTTKLINITSLVDKTTGVTVEKYKAYSFPDWSIFGSKFPTVYSNEVPVISSKNYITIVKSSSGYYYMFESDNKFYLDYYDNNYEYYWYLSLLYNDTLPYLEGTTQFDTSKIKAFFYNPANESSSWESMEQLPSINKEASLYLLPDWVVYKPNYSASFPQFLYDGREYDSDLMTRFSDYYNNMNVIYSIYTNYDLTTRSGEVIIEGSSNIPDNPFIEEEPEITIPSFTDVLGGINGIFKELFSLPKKLIDFLGDFIIGDNVGTSFFDNFNDQDNGGIRGIVTSPLRVINNLITPTRSCPDLSFTIMKKEVSLPSGCLIWSKVPEETVTVYQTLLCGFFSYNILISLYFDIQNLKNPRKDEVSTLDL